MIAGAEEVFGAVAGGSMDLGVFSAAASVSLTHSGSFFVEAGDEEIEDDAARVGVKTGVGVRAEVRVRAGFGVGVDAFLE